MAGLRFTAVGLAVAVSTAAIPPKRSNAMKRSDIITLPKGIVSVDALCITPTQEVFLVSSNAKLWRTTQKGVVKMPLKIEGKDANAWDVSCDALGVIRVVASGPDGVQVAGVLNTKSAQLTPIDLGKKEPRRLAWSQPSQKLWFTATDTTLNTLAAGQLTTEKDVRYNTVVASPSGTWIAARRLDTNTIAVRHYAATEWTSPSAPFQGQVLGISDSGETWLLDGGQWTMGQAPAQSRVLRSSAGKAPETVTKGAIQTGALGQKHWVLVHRKSNGLALEIQTLPR